MNRLDPTFSQATHYPSESSFLNTEPTSEAKPPEGIVTSIDLHALLSLIRPWQMSSDVKVRVGALHDGGYVMPSISRHSNTVLSIGIGNEVSFDDELAGYGAHVLQFDHTIEASPSRHENCQFHRLGWGVTDEHPFISLKSMIGMLNWDRAQHPIIKFDVEGAEWPNLIDSSSTDLAKFEMIVGEFHDFDKLPDRVFFDTVFDVFSKLNETHRAIHLHANNCGGMVMLGGIPIPRVLELTWIRINAATFYGHSNEPIPGPLDRPNAPQWPDLYLRAF